MPDELGNQIRQLASSARQAARAIAALTSQTRSAILRAMAEGIEADASRILSDNAQDVAQARAADRAEALVDRLTLNPQRISAMAHGVRTIADLNDPLGRVLETIHHANGMRIEKTVTPLGVIAIIYESRPNVTADAAALCFKAGNAVILRGGSDAARSNLAILDAMRRAAARFALPPDAIQLVATTDRRAVDVLVQCDRDIDLVIPRGGEGLIRAVTARASVPVLKHYKGICHVYVDAAADLDMALNIIENAKCQRPGVCNAAEALLVHRSVAETFLPRVHNVLGAGHGVQFRADRRAAAHLPGARRATEDDWQTEYLDLVLSVAVVDDLNQAIRHIETYGSHHSDTIITNDARAAATFLAQVDSATVYHNASTRFTDGGEFGMGAEIGISTDKLHARGPCGIESLTTYKYIIHGSGQIR